MADISFKQAKELIEKSEILELTLKKVSEDIELSVQKLKDSSENMSFDVKTVETLFTTLDKRYERRALSKFNKLVFAVAFINIGFIVGILFTKFVLAG
jgi:uncharacterized protein (UPF0335 family)